MSAYIVLERIAVQQANAIAGFTWGFPAITNFLGFMHNLSRKLNYVDLMGCGVVSHNHQIHAYQAGSKYNDYEFIQTKNPADTEVKAKTLNKKEHKTPAIIEEGKMHLTISLVIEYEGIISGGENGLNEFKEQLENLCFRQRLAGGTITNIESISIFNSNTEQDIIKINRKIKNILLPGFVLMDKNELLELHFKKIKSQKESAELVDAWLDFITLKQKAKPKSDLISNHFVEIGQNHKDSQIAKTWNEHLKNPYEQEKIPEELSQYFAKDGFDKKLLRQWKNYLKPNEKTDANWEYLPQSGYVVPIMTGYKAISKVYKNKQVQNTRDNETDICFVESVHSIAQWHGVHRLSDISDAIWKYDFNDVYYLCKQKISTRPKDDVLSENVNAESFLNSL